MLDTVRQHITRGQTEQALEALLQMEGLDEIITNQLLLLSGRFYYWKTQQRIGAATETGLHQITADLLDLVNEIESPRIESALIERTEFTREALAELADEKLPAVEAPAMEPIDFNVSRADAIEIVFHSKYWQRQERVLVPKDLTVQELIDAFVDHYRLAEVLVPFEYHKVEWLFLVNYRQVDARAETLEEIGLKDGDHVRIKGIFTKYGIKMHDGQPEPEIEIEIEETVEAEEAADEDELDV
jgi:hypothetical protein